MPMVTNGDDEKKCAVDGCTTIVPMHVCGDHPDWWMDVRPEDGFQVDGDVICAVHAVNYQ